MKIYMLNPPFVSKFDRSVRGWGSVARGRTLYYPIWLAYATGLLQKRYRDVRLVDAPAWGWDERRVIEDAIRFKPDLTVVDTNFASLSNDLRIAKLLKDNIEDIRIVVVGPPASQFPEAILGSDGVDVVARFEYDFSLMDITQTMELGMVFKHLKGISYKEGERIIHNPSRAFSDSKDLEKIPFVSKVYKNHLRVKDYFLSSSLYPEVQIFTGRGCPYRCTFCSWPENLMGRKYRVRSVGNVVDELEYIRDRLPEVKEVFFEDDTFTIDRKRVRRFCKEVRKRKLDIIWSCNARADLDHLTMKEMRKAGCRLIVVGYESGDDEILKNIKKGITTKQMKDFTRKAKEAGLMIHGDFIIGLPRETVETAKKTMNFIKELKPDILQVEMAMPIPGTKFYQWAKKRGFLLIDKLEYALLDSEGFPNCSVSYPKFTNRDIENHVNKILREYYLSLSYVPIALKNILRRNGLQELKTLMIATTGFLRYLITSRNKL